MKTEEIQKKAQWAVASALFPQIKNTEQACIIILFGHELGLGAVQALQNVNIMRGKLSMSAHMIAGLAKRQGYEYVEVQGNENEVIFIWRKGGKELGKEGFSLEDAKRAGLISNPMWKKYPRQMLTARALAMGARKFAPEAAAGLYDPSELTEDPQKPAPVEEMKPAPKPIHVPTKEEMDKKKGEMVLFLQEKGIDVPVLSAVLDCMKLSFDSLSEKQINFLKNEIWKDLEGKHFNAVERLKSDFFSLADEDPNFEGKLEEHFQYFCQRNRHPGVILGGLRLKSQRTLSRAEKLLKKHLGEKKFELNIQGFKKGTEAYKNAVLHTFKEFQEFQQGKLFEDQTKNAMIAGQ